ncbi:hypothetical protein MUK42_30302, partial [Musa troglodytarum]
GDSTGTGISGTLKYSRRKSSRLSAAVPTSRSNLRHIHGSPTLFLPRSGTIPPSQCSYPNSQRRWCSLLIHGCHPLLIGQCARSGYRRSCCLLVHGCHPLLIGQCARSGDRRSCCLLVHGTRPLLVDH